MNYELKMFLHNMKRGRYYWGTALLEQTKGSVNLTTTDRGMECINNRISKALIRRVSYDFD